MRGQSEAPTRLWIDPEPYYAKLENLQPVGAFKVRGGVNLVGSVLELTRHAVVHPSRAYRLGWKRER